MTDMLMELLKFVNKHATQKEAAKALGISAQYLADVLRGRRAVTDKLAKKLGFTRETRWRRS